MQKIHLKYWGRVATKKPDKNANNWPKKQKMPKGRKKPKKQQKQNAKLDFFVLQESKKQKKNKKKIKEILEEKSKTFNKILNDRQNEKKKDLHPFSSQPTQKNLKTPPFLPTIPKTSKIRRKTEKIRKKNHSKLKMR